MRGYWGLLAAGAMVAISASSCGRPNKLDLGAFEPYVTAYERESAKRGDPIVAIDLVIQFGQMEAAGQSAAEGFEPDCHWLPSQYLPAVTSATSTLICVIPECPSK
jgi:hypothetical protein